MQNSHKISHAKSMKKIKILYRHLPEWDEWQILCRGLIADPKRKKLIASPFPKFFNFGEFQNDVRKEMIDLFIKQKDTVQINEKMDGSLGIVFYCDTIKRWRCATRGSLQSRQAIWANDYLKKYANIYQDYFVKGHTYLCEVIWPDNKIIIEYDFEGLVLLAAYTENGYEYRYEYLQEMVNNLSPQFRISKRFYFDSVNEIMKAAEELAVNKEGWVIAFESGMRVKIKGKEYLAMAKVLQNITENMVQSVVIDEGLSKQALLDRVPEEFHDQVIVWYDDIYNEIEGRFKDIAYDLIATKDLSNPELGKYFNAKKKKKKKKKKIKENELKEKEKEEEEVEEEEQPIKLELRSSRSRSLLFPARKFIDEEIWKYEGDEYDADERVNQIVFEMMKNKDLKKKVMK